MGYEPPFMAKQREAVANVKALLALPLAEYSVMLGAEGTFNPWELFPCLYGSYSSEFDQCALEVLEELIADSYCRSDLGAHMFREMLCNADLCDYGTSPRVCFPTSDFRALLPELIQKWRAYSFMQWAGDVCTKE